jgi:hypothetical protein
MLLHHPGQFKIELAVKAYDNLKEGLERVSK